MSDNPITSEFLPESSRTTQDANARWVNSQQGGGLVGGEVRHREGSRRRAVDMMVCRPRAGVNWLRASLDSQETCGQFCCVVRANIVFNPRLGRSERDCVRGEDGFNCRVVRSVDNQERPRAGAAWLASVAELVFSCFNEWRFCGHRRGFRCGVKDRATIVARFGLVGLDSVINSLSGFVVAVIKIEVVGDKPSVKEVAACLLASAEHVDDRGRLAVQIQRAVNGADAETSHGITEEPHGVAVKEVAVVAAVVFGFDVSRSDGCSCHHNVFRSGEKSRATVAARCGVQRLGSDRRAFEASDCSLCQPSSLCTRGDQFAENQLAAYVRTARKWFGVRSAFKNTSFKTGLSFAGSPRIVSHRFSLCV
jgi:hypothetical protein